MKRFAAAVAGSLVAILVLIVLPLGSSVPLSGIGAASASVCAPGAAFAPPAGAQQRPAPLTGTQVAKAAYAAGWRGSDLVIAVAVAKAESEWDPHAINDNTNGSVDYGLFQINSVHGAILSGGNWRDPSANAAMAYQVWTGAGSSWRPWVTYWRGTYRQHLDAAQEAVRGIGQTISSVAGCSTDVLTAGSLADPGLGRQGPDGMTPRAANVRAFTRATWGCGSQPCISSIGGYARRSIAGTNVLSDHATGNAVDIMLPADYRSPGANALGWRIARFWQENAQRAGIKYVIFDAKIWSTSNPTWRTYSHPGGGASDNLLHLNHVHVSVVN